MTSNLRDRVILLGAAGAVVLCSLAIGFGIGSTGLFLVIQAVFVFEGGPVVLRDRVAKVVSTEAFAYADSPDLYNAAQSTVSGGDGIGLPGNVLRGTTRVALSEYRSSAGKWGD